MTANEDRARGPGRPGVPAGSPSRANGLACPRTRSLHCVESAPPLTTTKDLERHNCIVLRENNADYSLWRLGDKEQEHVSVSGSMISDDGDVVTDWCAQGLGLIMRSTWHGDPLIHQGVLQQVLADVPTPSALYPASTKTPRRITAAIEHLRQGLAARIGSESNPGRGDGFPAP